MSSVNELSGATFTITPLDESGQQRTPTNARYRLDDKAGASQIIDWTDITELGTELTVTIAATDNAIINPALRNETKVLTVETDYGTDDAHVEEFEYKVRNLQFVS